MAKNEHVVIRSACIAAIVVAVSNLALFAAATVVNLSRTDIFPHEETMIWAAMNLMPPLMGAILLAGVMAAARSSATTFLSLVGFSVSRDISPSTTGDDQAMLRHSRIMIFIVGAVTLAIALNVEPNIFWLTYYVGTIFASSWGPVAFMSVWSKRIAANAAYWGIITGFAGNVIPRFLDSLGIINLPSYLNPILIGGVISLFVVVFISRQGSVSEAEHAYRISLHQLPDGERKAAETVKTQRAAIGVAVFGALTSVLLVFLYVFPYQATTDTLGAGGHTDWLTGEALLSLAWAGIFVPRGIFAYRAVGRSYGKGEKGESNHGADADR